MLNTRTSTYQSQINFFVKPLQNQESPSKKCANAYTYGFNGKESDNEVKGSGNQYDYGFRIYDPRLGRFLSVDPLFKSYPWYTPYQFAGNDPIRNIDIDGLEGGSAIEYMFTGVGQAVESWWNSWSLFPSTAPNKPAPPIKTDQSKTQVKKTDAKDVQQKASTAGNTSSAKWVETAKKEVGQKENKEKGKDNERIVEYHQSTSGKFKDDETAWCSSFCNWTMKESGYEGTNSARALSWSDWGQEVDKPAYGAIAVIDWGGGKGHVGFVVGKKGDNVVVMLGGNQGDQVKYSTFKASDIKTYRMPTGYKVSDADYNLKEMDVKKENQSATSTR